MTRFNEFRFIYDSLGRRTRLNDPDIGEWNYTYDLVNNLISQAGGGGNLVTGDGFYREYNTLNQLVRIKNGSSASSPLLEQYYYDPFNERVKIWRNDTAGTTVYTPFREFMQIRNSTGVYNFTYVYDGSTFVARVNPDQSVYYYHPDHLGSTTLITDQSGNIVEETFYEPFGAVTSGGAEDVKLYTGQFSDELTNQYYYGTRYYVPSIGKFGQCDKIKPDVYDPQALNCYSYVYNNPYRYVDAEGEFAVLPIAAFLIFAYFALDAFDEYNENPTTGNAINSMVSLIPGGGIASGSKQGIKKGIISAATRNADEAAKASTKVDDASDAARVAKNIEEAKRATQILEESSKKIDNIIKDRLNKETLEAAQRELKGEVVAIKSSGEAYKHISKVEGGQRGLINQIQRLQRLLNNPDLSDKTRKSIQKEISRASKKLDQSEKYVPRSGNRGTK